MIRFLRNIFPPRVKPTTVELLVRSFEKLADPRFDPCIKQLRAGLLRFYGSSDVIQNYVGFTFMPGISRQFEERKGRWIRISGIDVSNANSSDKLSIFISHGLVCGYAF
jgi:hypothetical protein